MKTLTQDKNGKITFPKKYIEAQKTKGIVITMPRLKKILHPPNKFGNQRVEFYTRNKETGDKPYLPDNQISFKIFGEKEEIYQVVKK